MDLKIAITLILRKIICLDPFFMQFCATETSDKAFFLIWKNSTMFAVCIMILFFSVDVQQVPRGGGSQVQKNRASRKTRASTSQISPLR